MLNLNNWGVLGIIFILLLLLYTQPVLSLTSPNIYITIATFLFAIFLSYFIRRQSVRYNKIREQVAINDGHFSVVYRLFFYLSPACQAKAGQIIKKHFNNIIAHHDWMYNIKHKSTTLTDLNNLAADEVRGKKLSTLQAQTLRQIQSSLAALQITRKVIWTLYQEKLTRGQWILIDFLTLILLVTISFIQDSGWMIYAIKVLFGFVVVLVVSLLYKLDNFLLFKDFYGKQSSLDVIKIIEGEK